MTFDVAAMNALDSIIGMLVGGLVVVVGLRTQVKHLTDEIRLLRNAVEVMNTRIDQNAADIAYIRGRDDERRERGIGSK